MRWISVNPMSPSVASIRIPMPAPKNPPYTETASCTRTAATHHRGACALRGSRWTLREIRPCTASNTVAASTRYGAMSSKTWVGVCNSRSAPRVPPTTEGTRSQDIVDGPLRAPNLPEAPSPKHGRHVSSAVGAHLDQEPPPVPQPSRRLLDHAGQQPQTVAGEVRQGLRRLERPDLAWEGPNLPPGDV